MAQAALTHNSNERVFKTKQVRTLGSEPSPNMSHKNGSHSEVSMVARSDVNDLTDTTIAPVSSAMATNAGMPTSDGAPAAIEFDLSQSPPSDSRQRFEAEVAKHRATKRTLMPPRTRSMSAGRRNTHGISFGRVYRGPRACGPVDVPQTDQSRRRSRVS